ncbi:ComEC/Rec2 family competence protein [Methylophilus sp. QUAN]|uniref:ComEC/Rec2 family competence protein n=1 Tax=Methylophilus sp. QUAN TaxID=2781020 RepID=UPI00188E948A|nr:competence protein ComEC [Methylophilus sp. QUAN]MBF4989787.1 competence protein ComEC [Methylophilus sp. QUAN]
MADYFEIDFLGVETAKSGDAITLRYSVNGASAIHVVDGGYVETGDQIIEHLKTYYGTTVVDHVVLTHPDRDHANGLRAVLERCTVRNLWMNRPWIYADRLIEQFEGYSSVDALRRKLRSTYDATATLEDIAMARNIPIHAPLQGQAIGAFLVMAPTLTRYLELIVDSEKTPEKVDEPIFDSAVNGLWGAVKKATSYVKSLWGEEYFPPEPTSRENEMSVVQAAYLNGNKILLTGDAGREALQEVIDYAPYVGLTLPGIDKFQVPHHGGRHNVSTEILDQLVGPRLKYQTGQSTWSAYCSSAKADKDHPKKSVQRAMMHRGGNWFETEGKCVRTGVGIERAGWVAIQQPAYPEDQEE